MPHLFHFTPTLYSLAIRWLRIDIMLAVVNTITLIPRIMWIALLLLYQGSYKVHELDIRFVPLARFLCTISPDCDHSHWGSLRILAQVSP